MCGIPCRCDRTDDDNASSPRHGLAAISANVAFPTSIMDFAQRRQHHATHIAIGRQEGRYVLDDENTTLANLAEQTTSRGLRTRFFGDAESNAPSLAMVLVT